MKQSRGLTGKELREIRNLVTTMCANYDKSYCCCPLLDDYGCYILTRHFTGSGLCKYFRDAVLPLNPALEAVFSQGYAKTCEICGKSFVPTGKRQKYCPKCKDAAIKAANAKRSKRYRQRSKSKVTLLHSWNRIIKGNF